MTTQMNFQTLSGQSLTDNQCNGWNCVLSSKVGREAEQNSGGGFQVKLSFSLLLLLANNCNCRRADLNNDGKITVEEILTVFEVGFLSSKSNY